MLTLAYCRVSTEEQAEEGFSIEGQADKLRAYSALRDLGEVVVITDPGLSGKNMKRPGLQQVLAAVEAGHVSHVLIWRLDRLSRNLGDLILLADMMGEHNVALHSISENLDLGSASGRMFYNILGTFAQYVREQLSENVKMGMDRAVKEGYHPSRPKFGYNLIDRELVPNADAPRVQEVFRLRALGSSYRAIEDHTAIKYSTVMSILDSRVYLGEVPRNGQWFPGRHEAIITEAEFHAAHRAIAKGIQPSKDILSGRVICGPCGRRMALSQNGKGSLRYTCRHRGVGCPQPARSSKGLSRAAVLGLSLLGSDKRLQEAIRRELAGGGRREPSRARRRHRADPAKALADLSERRRKLFKLHFEDKVSAEGFKEEEDRISAEIEAVRSQVAEQQSEERMKTDLEIRFEDVARILGDIDIEAVWHAAEFQERRVLVEELVEWIKVFPDHLEVKVSGTPALNVLYSEVGLKGSEIVRVGGGT